MGFLRKATFVATGGASGLVFKANSKKERIANALEKQNRQQRVSARPRPASAPVSAVPPSSTFPLANYDGGCPNHPRPESAGTLILTSGKWELRFGAGSFFHGGLDRYPMTAAATGPKSCYVKMADRDEPTPTWNFELPKTSLATLDAAVRAAMPKPPPRVPLHAARDPQGQVATVPIRTAAPLIGVADEIAKLGKLKESGLLTDEEFASQKQKLLGS
jgi:hypothetical protein